MEHKTEYAFSEFAPMWVMLGLGTALIVLGRWLDKRWEPVVE